MIYAPVLGYSAREEQATLIGVKVRSPNERPSHQRVYARLATRYLGRDPAPTVPHVAISREERDLAHAG